MLPYALLFIFLGVAAILATYIAVVDMEPSDIILAILVDISFIIYILMLYYNYF